MSSGTTTPAPEIRDLFGAIGSVLAAQGGSAPLTPVSRAGDLPLSPAQERLWYLSQVEPDTPYYNVSLAWRVTGPLNAEYLQEAVHLIVRRHEILRLTFPSHGDRPSVQLSPEPQVNLRVIDMQSFPPAEREAAAFERARQTAGVPFDLAHGPLLRAVLYQLAPDDHLFVVNVHQAVFDGASMRLFSRELGDAYQALAHGAAPALPETPIQYLDFANWQRELLAGPTLENERAWWNAKLHSPYAPLRLPLSRPRREGATFPGGKETLAFPKELSEAMTRLTRQEKVTSFVLLLAGLHALLRRYTGQDDIVVFCSLAARTRPEFKNVIGLFANVAPLRSDSSGAVTFRDLLRRVHSSGLEALAHQMLPFHMIMESLRAAPGAGRVPLGQVMMIHQNAPLPVLHLGAVRFTPVEGVDNGAAKFDYLLDLADTKDGWRGSVKYRADLFDTAGVRRLIAGYQAALEAVTGNPDLPLDQLPVECPAVAAVVAEARREFVAPRDEAERQMAQLWAEVFRLPAVGVHDNFFELGGTSLLAAQLLERVRAATGKRLRLTTLFELPTVAQVTAALRTGAAGRGSTLVALKPAGALPPLFCFPGAAGNAMAFRELWSLLNPDQPVYATTEEKDLEGNPAAFAVLESLAADYLKDVRAMQPQGPYYFAGLCFGGLLAYEMACQLESQGERMACLLLLDPPPPGTARSLPGSAFRQGAAVFLKGLKQLPPRERIPRLLRVGTNIALQILDRWRISAEGLLLKLDPQGKVTRRLLDRRRTNVQAAAKYVPKPYHGALHLFMAAENGFTMNKVMEESWRKLGGGGFAAEILPGNHNSFFKAPHVQTLADRMNALLRQALQQAA